MKNMLHRIAILAVLAATALVAVVQGPIAAALTAFIGGYMLTPLSQMTSQLCVTLNATQILTLAIQAFRKRVPALQMMGTDFTGMALRKDQAAIARIRTLPTASTYSAGSGGYKNGAQSARGLLTDVPLTIDQWATCPIKMEHIYAIADAINDYQGSVGDAGYVLGKQIVDYALGLVDSTRFSQGSVIATADFDVDALVAIGEAMNGKTESNERFLLVNSGVASVLAVDQRLINSQWFGEKQGGETIRVWRNAFGFREIREYVDLPTNTGTALTSVSVANSGDLFTKAAHGLKTGQRVYATDFSAGFTAGYYYVIYASSSTFQLASTRANALAGTAVAASADGTGGVVTPKENMSAFAFERRAFAVMAGAPAPVTAELASQFGIPLSTIIEAMYDAETQTAMGMAKWQEEGTGDLYVCPTVLYGAKVGGDVAATAGVTAGAGLDYAGHIIRPL